MSFHGNSTQQYPTACCTKVFLKLHCEIFLQKTVARRRNRRGAHGAFIQIHFTEREEGRELQYGNSGRAVRRGREVDLREKEGVVHAQFAIKPNKRAPRLTFIFSENPVIQENPLREQPYVWLD